MRIIKLTIVTSFLLSTLACGIKGPPLPPQEADSIQKQLAAEAQAAARSADATKAEAPDKSKK